MAASPAAIVVAAGRGERARTEGSLPKQLRSVAGRPVVAWSIEALVAAGCTPTIVALPSDHLASAEHLLGSEGVAFVAGGKTRQESVGNALDAVGADRIVVHDGARPFITVDLVHAVLEAIDGADAAIPVLPVDDTLKEVEEDVVVRTIARARIRRVQTPQAFRAGSLRAAHAAAVRDGVVGTDDAQLVEMIGGRVVTVEGSWTNLKLTRPEDFAVAELFARP